VIVSQYLHFSPPSYSLPSTDSSKNDMITTMIIIIIIINVIDTNDKDNDHNDDDAVTTTYTFSPALRSGVALPPSQGAT
jgi:hypothetical protein